MSDSIKKGEKLTSTINQNFMQYQKLNNTNGGGGYNVQILWEIHMSKNLDNYLDGQKVIQKSTHV